MASGKVNPINICVIESAGLEAQLNLGKEEREKRSGQEKCPFLSLAERKRVVWQGTAPRFPIWKTGIETECILTWLTRMETQEGSRFYGENNEFYVGRGP